MRVYLPFTDVAPGVREALRDAPMPITEVYVGARDEAYWELLNSLWEKGQTFAIVEHDIIVEPGTLKELAECSGEWCSFASPYFNGVYHGMGCVKFSDTLIARYPKAMEQVAEYSDATHEKKHWCRLDAWLQYRVLASAQRHYHDTVLGHAKEVLMPSHGCLVA